MKYIERDIAKQRIEYLLKLARAVFDKDRELAQRYVEIALNISRRMKVKIPLTYKLFICKRCKKLLVPGVNCRVRIRQRREPHLVITCLECKYIMRRPIKKNKSSKETDISS